MPHMNCICEYIVYIKLSLISSVQYVSLMVCNYKLLRLASKGVFDYICFYKKEDYRFCIPILTSKGTRHLFPLLLLILSVFLHLLPLFISHHNAHANVTSAVPTPGPGVRTTTGLGTTGPFLKKD